MWITVLIIVAILLAFTTGYLLGYKKPELSSKAIQAIKTYKHSKIPTQVISPSKVANTKRLINEITEQ